MTAQTPGVAEETVGADEAAVTTEFIAFLKTASAKHHPSGVMPRFNQGRAAGCVDAEFTVARTACQRSFVSASSPSQELTRRAFGSRTPRHSPTGSGTFGACRSKSPG